MATRRHKIHNWIVILYIAATAATQKTAGAETYAVRVCAMCRIFRARGMPTTKTSSISTCLKAAPMPR